jgi:hypothetical protein
MLAGEVAIVACSLFTHIAYLWYNVIGAFVVVVAGLIHSRIWNEPAPIIHVSHAR